MSLIWLCFKWCFFCVCFPERWGWVWKSRCHCGVCGSGRGNCLRQIHGHSGEAAFVGAGSHREFKIRHSVLSHASIICFQHGRELMVWSAASAFDSSSRVLRGWGSLSYVLVEYTRRAHLSPIFLRRGSLAMSWRTPSWCSVTPKSSSWPARRRWISSSRWP